MTGLRPLCNVGIWIIFSTANQQDHSDSFMYVHNLICVELYQFRLQCVKLIKGKLVLRRIGAHITLVTIEPVDLQL